MKKHALGGLLFLAMIVSVGQAPGGEPAAGDGSAGGSKAPEPKVLAKPEEIKDLFGGRHAKLLLWVATGAKRAVQPSAVKSHQRRIYGFTRPHNEGAIWLVDFGSPPCKAVPVTTYYCWWGVPAAGYSDCFISPDGTRVAFSDELTVYACDLAAGGPNRTKVADDGDDPRWWIHPKTGEEYLVYPAMGLGETRMVRMKKGTCEAAAAPTTLLKGEFHGGRSTNGQYIFNAFKPWALAELKPEEVENAFVRTVATVRDGGCNESACPGTDHPDWFIWVEGDHAGFHHIPLKCKGVTGKDDETYVKGPGGYVQGTEWSTDPDFVTTGAEGGVWVYKMSAKKWVRLASGGGAHLWVEPEKK